MTSIATPICGGCAHLIGDLMDPKCAAFLSGIPREILLSQADHRQPYPGDQDVRFEARTPRDAEYAKSLFRPHVLPTHTG